MCKHVLVPEDFLQRDQLRFIVRVPVNVANDRLVLGVSVQAAEIASVNVHHRHVVPSLGLVVAGNDLRAVVPPVSLCVVVGGLDLQDCRRAVGKVHKIVQVSQHPRMLRVLEHGLSLIHLQPGLLLKDSGDQRLQKISHLHADPVGFVVLNGDPQLVVVEVSCRPEGRNAEDGRDIAAADPLLSPFQPLVSGKIVRIHQHTRLIARVHAAQPPAVSRIFLTRTQLLFALAEYLVGNEVHREFLPLTLFFRFMTSSPVHLKYSGNHAFSSSHPFDLKYLIKTQKERELHFTAFTVLPDTNDRR